MLWVPQKGRIMVEHNFATTGSANMGTSVTTGGSSSAKGTAVEIYASTSFDAYMVSVFACEYSSSGVASQVCLDILIGASTEEVIIPNLLAGGAGSLVTSGPKRWDFPLYIPAGSRIAAQAAGQRTSSSLRVGVVLQGGHGSPNHRVGGKVTTYGIGTVPSGTAITPGGSGAEGSWTEITASTSEDHFCLVPSFQVDDATANNRYFVNDIGIGSATEEMIFESYWYITDTAESCAGAINSMPVFQDIPSGTRLAMRSSCNSVIDAAYTAAIHAVS